MGTPNVLFVFSAPATQWKPLTGSTATTGFCTPDIALIDDGGGDVVLSGIANASPFTYKGKSYTTYPAASATLSVTKNKKPRFAFLVADANANTTTYCLGGLALKNMASGGGSGGANFPEIEVNVASDGSTTLQLQDANKGPANCSVSFDFWVMVQNSSGDLGLIDPLITNAN